MGIRVIRVMVIRVIMALKIDITSFIRVHKIVRFVRDPLLFVGMQYTVS